MKKILPILFLILISPVLYAQDISGHWFGVGIVKTVGDNNNYMSEMILRQKGKNIWGYLNYYFKDSLVKVNLAGSFDEQNHRLRIKPFSMIYFLSPSARMSIDCNMSGDFVFTASKTESMLSGNLVSDADHRYTTPNIEYHLRRSNDTADLALQTEIEQEEQPKPVQAPVAAQAPEYTQRKKIFTKELEIENPSIRIEIYDNGEIDYDSVSLYLNDKKILGKSMLTHKAIRLTLQLDPSLEYNELSMFAENLGMIPPNTAALIIYDGKTRYETLLSSDLSNNATIKLKKKK